MDRNKQEVSSKRRRVDDKSGSKGGSERKIETLAIHGGVGVDFKAHGAIFPPIFTATSFVQQSLSEHGDYCYGRVQNPTRCISVALIGFAHFMTRDRLCASDTHTKAR